MGDRGKQPRPALTLSKPASLFGQGFVAHLGGVSNPADQVAVACRRGTTTRVWFSDGSSASSPLSDTKTIACHVIGICVLVDGAITGVTPDGETQVYVIGTVGWALGMLNPFKLRQIKATGTDVGAADIYLAEGK